jgi:hypothetical protein
LVGRAGQRCGETETASVRGRERHGWPP